MATRLEPRVSRGEPSGTKHSRQILLQPFVRQLLIIIFCNRRQVVDAFWGKHKIGSQNQNPSRHQKAHFRSLK